MCIRDRVWTYPRLRRRPPRLPWAPRLPFLRHRRLTLGPLQVSRRQTKKACGLRFYAHSLRAGAARVHHRTELVEQPSGRYRQRLTPPRTDVLRAPVRHVGPPLLLLWLPAAPHVILPVVQTRPRFGSLGLASTVPGACSLT